MNPVLLRAFCIAVACCSAMSMPYSDRRAFADRMTKFASPQPRTRSLPDISPPINLGSASSKTSNGKEHVPTNKGHGNRRMNPDFVPADLPGETATVNIKTLPGYWIKDPAAMLNDTFDGLMDYRTEIYHIDDLRTTQQP